MFRLIQILFISVLVVLFSACDASREFFAPVWDAGATEHMPKSGVYRVKRKDTFYSIAWRYGLDYRTLAKRNGIEWPYNIKLNQLIYLRGKSPRVSVQRQSSLNYNYSRGYSSYTSPPTQMRYVGLDSLSGVQQWQWPAKGMVVRQFSSANKGVNIGGHFGDSIFASAAGKVVYAGNGLRGYGNLIIIKHNETFLTAYAYNSKNLVSEGERVSGGQKIAEMGGVRSNAFMLHFEIRRNGQPVSPLYYLSNK